MGRALKLLAGSAVAAAGVAVALAAAGPASAPAIICPLEPAQTITTPCCPPILTGGHTQTAVIPCCICCGPVPTRTPKPALIACLPLTIAATPDPARAGGKVTISGRLSAGTSGVTVALWQELPGSKTFSQIDTTTTNSSGGYRFVRTDANTNRQWYVTANGLHSFTIVESVHAVVKLSRSINVTVSPNHDGEKVVLQELGKHGWVVVDHVRLPQSFVISFPIPKGRVLKLRAVFPGDKRNIRSVSNVITVGH